MCVDGWFDGGYSSIKKVNLRFSTENTMTDILRTWYVGSGGHKYYPSSVVTECAYLIPHLQVRSDRLLTKKKKGKYPKFCMGYYDRSWYVGSGGQ